MTTAAFRIAAGPDLSSGISKSSRQNSVNPTLKHKIAKAFLDALYVFLDGLVLLASDESPISTGKILDMETPTLTGSNPLEQLDLRNGVSYFFAKRVRGTL
jgi:exocyst complex component 2